MKRLVLLLALLAPLVAGAAPPDPATMRAREHFERALRLYELTKFDEARVEYEKAYEEKPLPAFLFNIGLCYRDVANYEKAIYFFRSFLDKQPDAKNRDEVASQIEKLDEKRKEQQQKDEQLARDQAAQAAAVAASKESASAVTAAGEKLSGESAAPVVVSSAATENPVRRPASEVPRGADFGRDPTQASAAAPSPRRTPMLERWYFWVGVGGGLVVAAGLGAGIGYAATAAHLPAGTLTTIDAR